MVFGQASRSIVRQFTTSAVRRSQGWQQEGIPGSNLPFDIRNKTKLTLYFILFFTSGLTAPFILLRRHLLLQSSK
ncbi:Cytochrome c oxidase subunit 7C, mitochondrial [Bulinus truncatus]|nr:Cytochrome c oxidase subunit 7C, mitochondrial [Bulinus truncatus]